ncbi:serine hydrolase domain-containing protein [Niveispirillum sp. KHB5.9]|uniref:serine hydrolase domain-containing protein n=1 Tax=Niveispirillum sp. KHB5.9 TaxID=3400269 RepID=UPI003A87DCD2
MARFHVKALLVAASLATLPALPIPLAAPPAMAADSAEMTRLLDYLRNQNTTGFLVIQRGKVLIEKNWPAPDGNPQFALFAYERDADGALLEDVASQQKSFIAVLMAIAVDKGLVDIEKPVSDYIGAGWSKAAPDQEAKIRVIDLLTMSSGLDDKFGYTAPAGTVFFYNTPVYAVTKRVLAAAAKQPLEVITRDWLTVPAGMASTAWRKRPAVLASIGNDTGLVTSPRDTARFGFIILSGGLAGDGTRIVSEASMKAMLAPTATNPAYGRLWWLNGSAYTLGALGNRREGPLVAAAPSDMVAALGAFDRRLYVVPSRKLIVVRTGAASGDAKTFDEQLWQRLVKVIG